MRRPRLTLFAKITLRTRLTLTFATLFLVAGVVLLGATYALFGQQLHQTSFKVISRQLPPPGTTGDAAGQTQAVVRTGDGDVLTADQAQQWLVDQQQRLDNAATTSLLTQGGVALLVVGAAATAFAWLISGRVLSPLRRVTETAHRIARAPAADRVLHERIDLRGPDDEVKELADTFDTMIGRLDRSFDGQRHFIANASHELRTPLTLSRALVEVAMHRRTASADVRQLGENLLEISYRHERLISGLLLLATTENEVTGGRTVDLADVVDHVTAQTAAEAAAAGVTVRHDAGEAVTVGNALLLERLAHNLVENGIRHNAGENGWVRVATRTRIDGRTELEVRNTGPVVPGYEVPALFEPFHRLAPERLVTGKGAGLGLSIVRSVAQRHGGEVGACPREGGGLVVTVTLPGAEA